jgi:cytosine/uracil/thiamine/allantoin permease
VESSSTLVHKISLFNFLGLVPLLGLIVTVVPEFYTVGAFLGVLVFAPLHLLWARRAKAQEIKTQKFGEEPTNVQA